MILAEFIDAGTRPLIQRAAQPGMDRLTYTEIDCEEDWQGQLTQAVNEQMRGVEDVELAPWPELLSWMMPLDWCERHDGLSWVLSESNQHVPSDEWAPCPAGAATVAFDTFDPTNPEHTNIARFATPEEIRAAVEDPTSWLRLPFVNEEGGTELRSPLVARWDGLQSSRFTLAMADNDLFTPFDLTKAPDRYAVKGDDGREFEHSEFFSAFSDRAHMRVYLRPRKWRIYAHVWAHYEFITAFESVPNDEQFLKVYWNRPPVHPIRNDVRHTAGQQDMWHEYEGGWLSYDAGIDWAFDHSRAAAELRSQIVEEQWYSLCEAYVLTGVEAAKLTVSRVPPAVGEYVCGLGRIDNDTDVERKVWAIQTADVAADYPQTLIGLFWSDFF